MRSNHVSTRQCLFSALPSWSERKSPAIWAVGWIPGRPRRCATGGGAILLPEIRLRRHFSARNPAPAGLSADKPLSAEKRISADNTCHFPQQATASATATYKTFRNWHCKDQKPHLANGFDIVFSPHKFTRFHATYITMGSGVHATIVADKCEIPQRRNARGKNCHQRKTPTPRGHVGPFGALRGTKIQYTNLFMSPQTIGLVR